jgi:low temperature requirement protein LtrA
LRALQDATTGTGSGGRECRAAVAAAATAADPRRRPGRAVDADRFDTDDLLHRALVLAGMLGVIAMALSVHGALHGRSARFALAFVAVRGIVLLLNARARRHAAPAHPLLNLFLAAFSTGAALWRRLDEGVVRSVLRGLVWNYTHLPLLAGLVVIAVGIEYATLDAVGGRLERSMTAALGGETALYLLSTVVIGLAVRRGGDR